MGVTRTEWNALVLGNWNRAILTPAWIGKHLFGLESGTPVEVRVPIDEYKPYEITHDGVTVIPSANRLLVKPASRDFAALGKATAIAAKTIGELPRTPLLAAGINCSFKSDSPLELLSKATEHPMDNRLVDAGFQIATRNSRRALKWNEGYINVTVEDDEDDGRTIQINFHLADKENDSRLQDWLKRPVADFEEAVRTILTRYLDISLEDTTNAQ